jgi:pyridoxal phosphate enzyme (YggS family)
MTSLRENLSSVTARIAAACARAGRDPNDIRLVWVSKHHPRESALEALSLGARYFGENRVQEALEKFPLTAASEAASRPYELHLIGRLQKNKVRKILPIVSAIHSIDSLELLAAVDRTAGELGLEREVFLQVNTSREEAKGGFEPKTLAEDMRRLPPLAHVRLVGLMTMGPTPDGPAGSGPEETRRCFRELAALRRDLQASSGGQGPLADLAWLSMGMTGDFEIAIEEGAHFLRIGTALFGGR